jgi:hypothetical protein
LPLLALTDEFGQVRVDGGYRGQSGLAGQFALVHPIAEDVGGGEQRTILDRPRCENGKVTRRAA